MPQQPSYDTYTIAAAGATKNFNVDNNSVAIIEVTTTAGGPITLLANMAFSTTGTPVKGMHFIFLYEGQVTTAGFAVSFMGIDLTEAQALYKQVIHCFYTGSKWEVFILSDETDANEDINGANIVNGTITNDKLAGGITYANILNAAARGHILRAGAAGVWESVSAVDANSIVGGNGTDAGPQAVGGDLTKSGANFTIANDAITTVKILDANVTPAKLTTELRTEVITFPCSFETSEVGTTTFIVPFACSFTAVRAVASKTIAGTDAGTVVLKDNAGTTMTVTTPISFAASDALGTAYSSAITANNVFTAGQICTITTAKTTVGGRVILSITALRA